jgi:glycosyltransferase involved in cell wall biosynthesis
VQISDFSVGTNIIPEAVSGFLSIFHTIKNRMKSFSLSICIATYNRAGYIGETLDSILPQLDEDIELLVVDGASTDNTENIVRAYAKKKSNIRYIRLSKKGGVDQDYDKSVEFARGEFCWLFTDDDLLKPGAISAVVEAIKTGYGFIVLNAEVRNNDLSVILQSRRVSLQSNKIYINSEMENLFIDTVNYLSYIGAVIIRRNIWMSRDRLSYFGTEFIHVGVIFQKPLLETALFIAEPYITIRHGIAQWEPRRFEIWMVKWPTLLWSFKNFSTETLLRVSLKEPWRKFRMLMILRSSGNYNIQEYRQYLSAKKAAVLWKFCAILIALLPRKIFDAVRYIFSLRKIIYTPIHSNEGFIEQ